MSVPCVHYIYYIIQKKVGYLRESGKANKEMTSLRFVFFFISDPVTLTHLLRKKAVNNFYRYKK